MNQVRLTEMPRNETGTSYCAASSNPLNTAQPLGQGSDKTHSNGRPGDFLSHLTTISFTPSCSPGHDITPPQEDPQTQFYKEYRKVAEEYDKDFLKKYEEDLNTTLIFVSLSGFSLTPVDQQIRLDCFPP